MNFLHKKNCDFTFPPVCRNQLWNQHERHEKLQQERQAQLRDENRKRIRHADRVTRDLPLQPYNCVDWEGIEVPTFGCATNLAHLLGPRAGARLYHQGRYRNRDNTSSGQKPGCEPADMAQPPQAPAAAQSGDLYRLPCKSRTPQLPVTVGTPLGLPGGCLISQLPASLS